MHLQIHDAAWLCTYILGTSFLFNSQPGAPGELIPKGSHQKVILYPDIVYILYFCIPNRRLDLVQAQMPAFLAEAHADAEAQAQVQGAQVQVQAAQAQAQVT